jgi:hypothetical protein
MIGALLRGSRMGGVEIPADGAVVELDAADAAALIERGYAEPVGEPETAEQATTRVVVAPERRGPGRPRKSG